VLETLTTTCRPLEDLIASNKQHGWKVTRRAAATLNRPSAGAGSGGGGTSGRSAGLLGFQRIELGVLLGAGSFGRVYKGRWQGGCGAG
jgi:hypothetical protein